MTRYGSRSGGNCNCVRNIGLRWFWSYSQYLFKIFHAINCKFSFFANLNELFFFKIYIDNLLPLPHEGGGGGEDGSIRSSQKLKKFVNKNGIKKFSRTTRIQSVKNFFFLWENVKIAIFSVFRSRCSEFCAYSPINGTSRCITDWSVCTKPWALKIAIF